MLSLLLLLLQLLLLFSSIAVQAGKFVTLTSHIYIMASFIFSFPLSLFPSFSQLSQGAEHKGPGLPNRVAGGYSSFLFFPHSPHLFSAFPHSQNRVASGSHGMAAQKSDRGTFTLIKGPFQPEFCPKTEPKALSGLTKTEGSLH